MKILYLTGAISSPYNIDALPFIAKRVEALYSCGYNTHNVTMVGVYSRMLSSFIRMKYKDYKRIAPKDWNPKITQNGIAYEVLPYNISLLNFYKLYPNALTAYRLLKDRLDLNRFDLVHAHWSFPEGEIGNRIYKEYNIPYIMTCHGYDINILPNKNRKTRESILKSLEESAVNIFVSDALLGSAKKIGYSGKNSRIIPNGFDPSFFKYEDKQTIRKELNIYRAGQNYVGFVGSLSTVKGADRLPAIFNSIADSIKNVVFIIVGEGLERKNIERNIGSKNTVFTGRLRQVDVAKYMQAMDVMVIPSRSEGWGCVVKEAQACGTPVVGSNLGGIPEAVGEGGRVVDEGLDFEKRFAETVVEELRLKPGSDKALRSAVGYTWRETIIKEISVYKSIGTNPQ